MATPMQMKGKGQRGIPWTGHFGFWSVTFIVHPVLASATARMWPLWQGRGGLIAACLIFAGYVGYKLQNAWSRAAGSSDAWSQDGRPNDVGIIHIQHMSVEVGIMLMLLISGLWYREMPWPMFFGVLAIIVNHFIIGTHWPLRVWFPEWRPEDMGERMSKPLGAALCCVTFLLLFAGFGLLMY